MTADGRPLRFLAVVLVGWTMVRVAILWPPIEASADATDAIASRLAAAERTGRGRVANVVEHRLPIEQAAILSTIPGARVIRHPPSPHLRFDAAETAIAGATPSAAVGVCLENRARAIAEAAPAHSPTRPPIDCMLLETGWGNGLGPQRAETRIPEQPLGLPLAPRTSSSDARWSGSGWGVLRGDGAAGAAFGGSQLGGSQAGARLAYAIDSAHRLQLVGRVASPLRGRGREAAIGVAWQPTRAPVRVVAEQRFAIDGGRGGPTIGVIGGVGPAAVAPGVTLEAYGQAGAIARDGVEGFVDGAARVAHPVAAIGKVRFDLGAGAWGAAQRAAARLDVGPSLAADLPLGRRAHVRVALDWRARIAGDARPGSGLVLSLGTDF
ncbi:hypothetical protein DFR49_2711 [Hephaestia caeni]|uniref:Uncharacterized protein n=1 Tax=Hephaestia caeni TaxID=645617 RepID=A0A397P4H3_9SPHN|nr:hypothetical protein [Hephaestia caeni]RIA44466.1 hypothetical protein DFR49_2711 [Hephaestia caeni]